jgi:hypothetical protein
MRSFVLSRAQAANYPGVFQEAVQLIGEEAAAKLVVQYGGVRLYIPHTAKPNHTLCQLLGQEIAQQLCGEFAGLTLDIPRGYILQVALRNKLVMADRAAGMSQRELALKHHLTERTIRKIVNRSSSTNHL